MKFGFNPTSQIASNPMEQQNNGTPTMEPGGNSSDIRMTCKETLPEFIQLAGWFKIFFRRTLLCRSVNQPAYCNQIINQPKIPIIS